MIENIERDIGAIKEAINNVKEDTKEIRSQLVAMNGRVRKTEQDIAQSRGIMAVIGSMLGLIGGFVGGLVKGWFFER